MRALAHIISVNTTLALGALVAAAGGGRPGRLRLRPFTLHCSKRSQSGWHNL
jgi:hypothetical protein